MTNVFISYSRKDTTFARRLYDALTAQERSTWADWEGIPYSVDFWREIQQGIDAAEVFVFIISPDSLASMVCNQEIAHARRNNKRIVPIMHRTIDEKVMAGEWFSQDWENTARENWIELKRLNWLFFREADDFDQSFASLMQTIDLDPELVRFHTRVLVKAREWEAVRDRDHGQLLRGEELQAAEAWLKFQADKPPKPTDLHLEYIRASLAQREQERIAEQKRQQRLRVLAVVLSILLVFAVIAAAIAINRTQVANQNADLASTNEAVANRRALEARSLALAANAQVVAETDSELALALAVEANTIPDPPLLAQSILSRFAYRGGQVLSRLVVDPFDRFAYLTAAHYSPDGAVLALGMSSGAISLWDARTHVLIRQLTRHEGSVSSIAFSADGTLMISGGDGRNQPSDLRLWTVETGNYVALEGHTRSVSTVAFNLEGTAFSTDNGGVVRAWDSFQGNLLWETDTDTFPIESLLIRSDISPDGNSLYVTSFREYGAYELNTTTGAIERTVSFSGIPKTNNVTGCFDIRVHPDGARLLCSASIIDPPGLFLVDLAQGNLIRSFQPVESSNFAVTFSPDGSRVLSGDSNGYYWWDTETGRILKQYQTPGSNALAISPNASQFVADDSLGNVLIWDLTWRSGAQDGDPIHEQQGYTEFAYDPTGGVFWVSILDQLNSSQGVRVLDEIDGGTRAELPVPALALKLLPDGSALVGTTDNTLGRWSLNQGDPLWQTSALNASVAEIVTDRTGTVALIRYVDQTRLTLWNTTDGSVIREIDGMESRMDAIALTPDGKWTGAIGCTQQDEGENCLERELFVWDIDTGELLYRDPAGGANLAVTPDGRYWVIPNTSNQVELRDISTRQLAKTLNGHTDTITALAVNDDGTKLVSGSSEGEIFVWDVISGFPLRQFDTGNFVWDLAWLVSGDGFISYSSTINQGSIRSLVIRWRLDDTIDSLLSWTQQNRLWGDFTCTERAVYDIQPLCGDMVDAAGAVALLPTRTPFPTVAVSPSRSPRPRTATPTPTATPTSTLTPTPAPYVYRSLYGVRWSPDGTRLLAGEISGFVVVWDVASRTELYRLEGHDSDASVNGPRGVWSPDGSRIATYSAQNTARIWDADTGVLLHTLAGHSDHVGYIDWSPDSTRLVTASDDGTARIWDTQTGEEMARLDGHEALVNYARFSPDGTRIATAGDDGRARVWDASTGAQQWVFAERDQPIDLIFQQLMSAITVTNVVWSPDGNRLMATGSDGAAIIWNTQNGERVETLRVPGERGIIDTLSYHISDALWSPDGQRIVLNVMGGSPTVWDVSSSQLLFTLEGHNDLNLPPRWSADGMQLITAGYDGTIRIWDGLTGQQVLLMDHRATLYAAAWSPDGSMIASVAENGTVRLWDASSGAEVLFVAAVPASQVVQPQVTLYLTEAAATSLPMQQQMAEVLPTFGVALTASAREATATALNFDPAPTQIRTQPDANGVLFTDDFAQNAVGWETDGGTAPGIFSNVRDGMYVIDLTNSPTWFVAAGFNAPQLAPIFNIPFEMQFELDAIATDQDVLGVMVVFNVMPEYTSLTGITAHENGRVNYSKDFVLVDELEGQEFRLHRDRVNLVRLRVSDSSYQLYINDALIVELPADEPINGTIGFGFGSDFVAGDYYAEVDNLLVRALPGSEAR
ncbi:MAG: PD40 domain-containing protein [Anaerolineae bacterium]|nr:PD40 domain-containing protein [Anaerolineae bacterium]